MNILRLMMREMRMRSLSVVFGILAVAAAAGGAVRARVSLARYDRETAEVLRAQEIELADELAVFSDDMRKATLKLMFNVIILPADQEVREWLTRDYGSKTMPEDYVDRLANSNIVSVQHLLPSLQQTVEWPEFTRRTILVGSRGEVTAMHKRAKAPLVQPVPEGGIVLGHELHQSLGLSVGDPVRLMGREYRVHACYDRRGSKDDITAWIPLKDAQELLGLEGRINAILALECLCSEGSALELVRRDVAAILPGTQVIEHGTNALARAEARLQLGEAARATLAREKASRSELRADRVKLLGVVVPLLLGAAALWLGLLAVHNVRERASEIALLRALGVGGVKIFALLFGRAVLVAAAGCGLGLAVGLGGLPPAGVSAPSILFPAAAAAFVVTVAGVWVPVILAVRRHPAEVLN